jgi:hypothetical protein
VALTTQPEIQARYSVLKAAFRDASELPTAHQLAREGVSLDDIAEASWRIATKGKQGRIQQGDWRRSGAASRGHRRSQWL